MLTAKDVAKRLNISLALVYALAESGAFAGYRIGLGRGTWRFDESDVDAYLQSSKTGQTPQPVRQRGKSPRQFKHLNGERLREAWRRQGVLPGPTNEDSALSCES